MYNIPWVCLKTRVQRRRGCIVEKESGLNPTAVEEAVTKSEREARRERERETEAAKWGCSISVSPPDCGESVEDHAQDGVCSLLVYSEHVMGDNSMD